MGQNKDNHLLKSLEEILKITNGLRTDLDFAAACANNILEIREIASKAIAKEIG